MPDSTKYTGWVQLAAGIAAIFLQIWGAIHGVSVNTGGVAVGAGLAAGGLGHLSKH